MFKSEVGVRSKIVAFLILSIFAISTSEIKAVAAVEVDIASMSACPVSLQNIWGPFGNPHPCYTDGTILKIAVPSTKLSNYTVSAILNGESFPATPNSFFSIPRYNVGLNLIDFKMVNLATGDEQFLSSTKFIIYQPVVSLRVRTLSVAKIPYVITLADGVLPEQVVAVFGIGTSEYKIKGLKGSEEEFSSKLIVADLSDQQFTQIILSPLVKNVFREGIAQISATQNNSTWGLDRLDQAGLPLNSTYNYDYSGAGVDIYIVDSGIRTDHSEFTGRITASMYADTFTSVSDCNGHGTHVAGTAAGTLYGVAKSANIIPVRVMDCQGYGTYSDIQTGINWIINRHTSSIPAVANFSLGGGYNSTMNAWMQSLIDDGVVTVVAAGNDAGYACNYSPASAPNAITVGASSNTDRDADFSNVGACVDIFAPGVAITSAGITSNSSTLTQSGTSMASPHVAGAAALILEEKFSTFTNQVDANALVRDFLLQKSVSNVLRDSLGQNGWWSNTVNKLLNVNYRAVQPQASLSIQNSNLSGNVATALSPALIGGSGSGSIALNILSGNCKVIAEKILAFDVGACSVRATKAADDSFTAITSSSQTFTFTDSLTHGPWKSVSVGWGTTCAIKKSDETLYCWGMNDFGQIGKSVISAGTVNAAPQQVSGIPGRVKQVSVGAKFACAVNSLSNLHCWGKNASGQIGNNSTTNSITPETVTSLNGNVKSVSAGSNSTCAVTLDGKAYCWGDGLGGKLGTGSTSSSLVPALVTGMSSGVTLISVGEGHACAIQSGGVKCWGNGSTGALGDGQASQSSVPVSVSGLTSGVTKITSGYQQSCALKGTTTYCWGYNQYGTIGDGTTTQRNSPVALTGLASNLNDINLGQATACGINSIGGLMCWGQNANWQVGNNSSTNIDQLTPSAVAGLTKSVASISSSTGNSCAIAEYGRLFCWGDNTYGQLGNGDTTLSRTAFQSSLLDYNLNAPLTPIFAETLTARTLNSIQLQISNFDSNYIWSALSSSDTSTTSVTPSGLVTVTGLTPGETVTVTAYTSQLTFDTGTATSLPVRSLSLGRTPTFDTNTVTSLADGFRVNLVNYDTSYQWLGASSRESATVTISDTGTVTVSGVNPGTASTVTISTTRSGYSSESATSLSYTSLTAAGLLPIIDSTTAMATGDGFTVNITNYDPAYTWAGASTINGGLVTISNTGRITMTGIASDTSSQAVITTSRTGYVSRSETTTSITSLMAGLLTTFETRTSTADGFTIFITNLNNLYSYTATSTFNGGLATVSSEGLVTVTNIPAGTSSTVIVTTSRSGYGSVSAVSPAVISIAAPPPPPPAPAPAPAPTSGGGGVGTTWFNLFISNPNDPALVYSGEACALFILKSTEGDKQFGPICASKAGALDYEANDGDYLIRTFDKASPKYFKEYKAKVTFGTFEVVGAGYRGGSVPRRVITVLNPSEYPVEVVVAPTPTPTVTPMPTNESATAQTQAVVPAATASPVAVVLTMVNNGSISTVKKSSTTKIVSTSSSKSSLFLKKNSSLALTFTKVSIKSTLTLTVTLPTGEKVIAATIPNFSKNSYSPPAFAFKKIGQYTISLTLRKSFKSVTITVK